MYKRSEGINCPDCPHYRPTYDCIEVCEVCGIGRTTTVTRRKEDQDYLSDGEDGGQLRPKYFSRVYSKYFKNLQPGRALDVGCGRGELVDLLCENGWFAHGIDSYTGFQGDGERYFLTDLDCYVPEESYDLICLIHSLEHMSDPVAALRKVASILSPNGNIFIAVPNFGGVWSRSLGQRWHMLRPEDHAYHYTTEGLPKVLLRCGFKLQELNTYSGYAPSPWQISLAETKFYEAGFGSTPIVRSLIFRTNNMLRSLVNVIVDYCRRGAEVQVRAKKG